MSTVEVVGITLDGIYQDSYMILSSELLTKKMKRMRTIPFYTTSVDRVRIKVIRITGNWTHALYEDSKNNISWNKKIKIASKD